MQEFLTKEEEEQIVNAISLAEQETSGEIKVHIESDCNVDALERAKQLFAELKMHETKLQNGVILYIAFKAHKFAIYGGEGINNVVPTDFWESVAIALKSHFVSGNFAPGITAAIHLCGEKLKTFFPYHDTDTNELSNDISFGK